MGLRERILDAVQRDPGVTDRQLADLLLGPGQPQQAVNQAARALASLGMVIRAPRADGRIGNFAGGEHISEEPHRGPASAPQPTDGMTEDQVKAAVANWLQRDGWSTTVRWGHERGIDIEATRDDQRWVIEAKGCGSRQPMRVNYFIGMLGETLQRMDDPNARYSIALPGMAQYRRLWERLPRLAKDRTAISIIFVSDHQTVSHLE